MWALLHDDWCPSKQWLQTHTGEMIRRHREDGHLQAKGEAETEGPSRPPKGTSPAGSLVPDFLPLDCDAMNSLLHFLVCGALMPVLANEHRHSDSSPAALSPFLQPGKGRFGPPKREEVGL